MPLEFPTLSAPAGWFTLSTSEAEDEGDSPKGQVTRRLQREENFKTLPGIRVSPTTSLLAYLEEPFAKKSAIHFDIY